MVKMKKGFTLIELLIVVAIIAILAAIAIPNFLSAQTRSKVSRAKADMASLATAIESYEIDYNCYPWPFRGEKLSDGTYYNIYPWNNYTYEGLPLELSSPISYISSDVIWDPFINVGRAPYNTGLQAYRFNSQEQLLWDMSPTGNGNTGYYDSENPIGVTRWEAAYGQADGPNMSEKWVLYSVGPCNIPDAWSYPGSEWWVDTGPHTYDPTNGTVSFGNIYRFGP